MSKIAKSSTTGCNGEIATYRWKLFCEYGIKSGRRTKRTSWRIQF